MKPILTVLLALASAPTCAATVVPERFQGEWNIRLDHCCTALNDSAVKITRSRIKFYESSGDISQPVESTDPRRKDLAQSRVLNTRGGNAERPDLGFI